jgi:hypothetical protein
MDRDEHPGTAARGYRGALAQRRRRPAFANEKRPGEAGPAQHRQDLAGKHEIEFKFGHASRQHGAGSCPIRANIDRHREFGWSHTQGEEYARSFGLAPSRCQGGTAVPAIPPKQQMIATKRVASDQASLTSSNTAITG